MAYTVTGTLSAGRGETRFERTVDAHSDGHARELVLSQLSSEHGCTRAQITVETVEEAAA